MMNSKFQKSIKILVCIMISLVLIFVPTLNAYAMTDEELRYWLGNSNGSWSVGQSAWFIMEMLSYNFGYTQAGNTFRIKDEMLRQNQILSNQSSYLQDLVSEIQDLNANQSYDNCFTTSGNYLGWKRNMNDSAFSDSTITLRAGEKIYLGYYFTNVYGSYAFDNGFYVVQVPFYSLNGMDISPELTGFYFKSYAGNPTNSRIIDESEIMNQPQYYGSALYLQDFSPYDVGSQYVYYFEFTVGEYGGTVYRSSAATPSPTIVYAEPSQLTFLSKLCLNVSEMNKNQMNIFNEQYPLLVQIEDYLEKMSFESAAFQSAKINSEAATNAGLTTFTGNGAGAITAAGVGDMGSVSTSIQSGLSAGGSISHAAYIFSATGGAWDWFTQSNYNSINTLSRRTNSRKSRSNDEPEVIDFLSMSQDEVNALMQEISNNAR